jgi:hypothetical protein
VKYEDFRPDMAQLDDDPLRPAKAFTYSLPVGLALWIGGAMVVWAIYTALPA